MRPLDPIRYVLFTACAAAAVHPLPARSSGFALLEQSASRFGAAFAGTTTAAEDATTNFFNPAGLTHLEQFEVAVVASGIDIKSQFHDQGSQRAFGQLTLGSDGGDAGGSNFVPSAYLATPIGDSLAFGLGVNAPFGLATDYEAGWMGRFQALLSEIKTLNVNPSLAWRVNDRFSIGLGADYQRLDAELTNAVNYSAVVAQGVQRLVGLGQLPAVLAPAVLAANVNLEGGARVEGDDDTWGYNIGLLFDASDATRIGISYRSKMEYEVTGSVTFAAPTVSNVIGAAIVNAVSAAGGPLASGPARVDIELPDIATVSLQQRLGDAFTLYADVGWTGWSSIQELRVVRDTGAVVSVTPEEWEDAWRFALGGAYEMSDVLTLRAGVAYDESAVPDSTRTPRLPDTNRKWLAIGAGWRPSKAITLDFGYAHLFSDDVPLNHSGDSPAASGVLVGEQRSDIDIVSAQFIYRFE